MRAFTLLAALPLMACTAVTSDNAEKPGFTGSGSGNSRAYQVADFTKVALMGADDIDVRIGNGFSVRAEGDPEVLDYLTIEKDGDTLKVGRRNRPGFSWGDRDAKVFVTMPQIASGAVLGAGDLSIDRAEGPAFAANIAGAGNIDVAQLKVDNAELTIAGAGDIETAGTARSVTARIAGTGDIDGEKLAASGADVSIAGAGSIRIAVDGAAKVSILGTGDVNLGSKARCTVSKKGPGSVTCGN